MKYGALLLSCLVPFFAFAQDNKDVTGRVIQLFNSDWKFRPGRSTRSAGEVIFKASSEGLGTAAIRLATK